MNKTAAGAASYLFIYLFIYFFIVSRVMIFGESTMNTFAK